MLISAGVSTLVASLILAAEPTQVIANPHTSVQWTADGVVGHLPAFAHAFGYSTGDPMVIPLEKRMQIW